MSLVRRVKQGCSCTPHFRRGGSCDGWRGPCARCRTAEWTLRRGGGSLWWGQRGPWRTQHRMPLTVAPLSQFETRRKWSASCWWWGTEWFSEAPITPSFSPAQSPRSRNSHIKMSHNPTLSPSQVLEEEWDPCKRSCWGKPPPKVWTIGLQHHHKEQCR